MRLSIAGIYFRGFKSWNILLGFIFTDGGILIIPRGFFYAIARCVIWKYYGKSKFLQYLNKSFTEDVLTV